MIARSGTVSSVKDAKCVHMAEESTVPLSTQSAQAFVHFCVRIYALGFLMQNLLFASTQLCVLSCLPSIANVHQLCSGHE